MFSDLRYACRALAQSPGFTAIAVFTLALAIGVNSAVFSLVNGLALRPVVPLRPAEVVNLFTARQDANKDYRQFSHGEFLALRENNDLFADVAAVQFALAGIGRDESMRRSFAFFVSDNFFHLVGTAPAAGRFFSAAECRPNSNVPVVVASWSFWQHEGGRPDFVGSTLRVNGRPYTVIGVTAEGFSGLHALIAPELWLPLGVFTQFAAPFGGNTNVTDLNSPKNYTLNLTARLQPGLTLEAAQGRLPVLARRLTTLQPPDATGARELQIEHPSRFSLSTTPSHDGSPTVLAVTLLGMAGCVLLIACLNLANMLLARGTARAREMAVRLAIGATRWQVVRQLLVEGLVLALAGGALGLLFAVWTNSLLLGSLRTLFSSMNFSLVMNPRPDAMVLGATLLFCLLATLLFSLGPALRTSRADLVQDLKAQAGDPAVRGRWNRFFAPRHLLVMAQMTLSLVLLFAAGLFLRGALKAGALDLGFEPTGGLIAEMDFSLGDTSEADAKRTMLAALDRVRAVPGVQNTALATQVPYGNITNSSRIVPATAAPSAKAVDKNAPDNGADAYLTAVTPGYFDTVGVRLRRGRDFTFTEAADKASRRVAIIDEDLAKKLFPGGDALGQRIRYTEPPADGSPAEMEIVGLCAPLRHDVLDQGSLGHLFVPLAQSYNANVFLHARLATKDPAMVAVSLGSVRAALRGLDPDLPVLRLVPFTALIEKNIGLWVVRVGATLFGVFGGIALLLASIGLYGVKAYAVGRRTRENGIRMALGADRRDIFSLIMRQGAGQIAVALGAGVGLSLLAGQVLASMLYKVSPRDPVALGIAASVLALATLLACYLPARRAVKVAPNAALRAE